jgi:ComF family protein
MLAHLANPVLNASIVAMKSIIRLLSQALDLCLPSRCLLCEQVLDLDSSQRQANSDHLCVYCRLALPFNLHPCIHCALPLSQPLAQPLSLSPALPLSPPDPQLTPSQEMPKVCGPCAVSPLADQTLAPLLHEGAGAYLLHRLKFGGGEAEGITLARLMLVSIKTRAMSSPPDLLIPVPLNHWALVRRGFNQSALLAHVISQALGVPVATNLIGRRRGPAQRTLSRSQRQRMARGRFFTRGRAKAALSGKQVAIIDDVLTTGATAKEMVRLLYGLGVARAEVWCATRAPADSN